MASTESAQPPAQMPEGLYLTIYGSKSSGEVLYAEAPERFVNLLLEIIHMPIGEFAKQFEASKYSCKEAASLHGIAQLLARVGGLTYYTCSCDNCHKGAFTMVKLTPCPKCGHLMDQEAQLIGGSPTLANQVETAGQQGAEPKLAPGSTILIADNLRILPSSTAATMAIANQRNISLSKIEHLMVEVGRDEAMEMVRLAFHSKSVLQDLFGDLFKKAVSPSRFSFLRQSKSAPGRTLVKVVQHDPIEKE